ncbi:unnamed protein product [Cunninghamella blakesleeana]
MNKSPNYGVTQPLSVASSSANDILLQNDLVDILKENKAYDTTETAYKRLTVLKTLDTITKKFVYEVCLKKGMNELMAKNINGVIRTYGSYQLGVNAEDGDIDVLCILPSHVTREDFFEHLYKLIKQESNVDKLSAVTNSYVPVIKCRIDGIWIDFICTILPIQTIPEDFKADNIDYIGYMDETCIRSLNGIRVGEEILALVPNVETFRISLRCIKLWATKRGIYSNILGFLGGVAWAILVARVCQLYPNTCASTVVGKFFGIIADWTWPSPVLLKSLQSTPNFYNNGFSSIKSWNPRLNPNDKKYKMPIITPTYPNMCTTHNVSESTMKIMLGELKLAAGIVNKVMHGFTSWDSLFKENSFFQKYHYYIQIVTSANDESKLVKWSGFVEAKLRHLSTTLENLPFIALVHPHPNSYEHIHYCRNIKDLHSAINTGAGAETYTSDSIYTLYSDTFYIGLYIPFETGKQIYYMTIELIIFSFNFLFFFFSIIAFISLLFLLFLFVFLSLLSLFFFPFFSFFFIYRKET